MIRSSLALAALFEQGRTVVRMADFAGGCHFRWITADTNESVHGQAIKTLEKKGVVQVIARDLCGDPMQLGAMS